VKPSSRRYAMRAVAACARVQPTVKASVMTFSVASESEQIG
jgi:hypothetical protein